MGISKAVKCIVARRFTFRGVRCTRFLPITLPRISTRLLVITLHMTYASLAFCVLRLIRAHLIFTVVLPRTLPIMYTSPLNHAETIPFLIMRTNHVQGILSNAFKCLSLRSVKLSRFSRFITHHARLQNNTRSLVFLVFLSFFSLA